jgi:poly(A) polymerase
MGLISRDAPLVTSVAGERLRDELLAILSVEGAKGHLKLLDGLGLLCRLFPELETTRGVSQPREHFWDVFHHSLETVETSELVTSGRRDDPLLAPVPWDGEIERHFSQEISDGHNRRTILKLAALLHDIAKPQTRAMDEAGRTRFFGHHNLGAAMAEQALLRLRISSRGIKAVCGMIQHHLRPSQMGPEGEFPTDRAIYRYFRDLGEVAIDTLYLSLADYLAARGPDLDIEDWERYAKIIRYVLHSGLREKAPQRLPRLISGHDIMETFGLPPGPRLGRFLEAVREAQAAGEIATREEALAWVRRRLESGEEFEKES